MITKIKPYLKRYSRPWSIFLDFLFPKKCLNCGKIGNYYCVDCFHKLDYLTIQICPRCKKPKINGAACISCKKQYNLDGLLAAGSYGNERLRKIIKVYKFQSVEDLHLTLGKYLNDFLKQQIRDFKITLPNFRYFQSDSLAVIPMPISKSHLRFRGFNQSELIAGHIAGDNDWKVLKNSLIKNKNTRAQTKVSEKKRLKNPLGSFSWQGQGIKNNVLLIDDVFTTGSTMNEAARIIKENGAKKVWGLVIARGK